MRQTVDYQADVAEYEHVAYDKPEDQEGIGVLRRKCRATRLASSTSRLYVQLYEHLSALDSPDEKEGQHDEQLDDRDHSQSPHALPVKRHLARPYALVIRPASLHLPRNILTEEVHKSKADQRYNRHDDVQVEIL